MQILVDRTKELSAYAVPPGLYLTVKPQIGELVVKLRKYTDSSHYLSKQRWVNLEGISDMTPPDTVYPVTIFHRTSGPATTADIPSILEAVKENHKVPLQLD